VSEGVGSARLAFDRHAWRDAYDGLSVAAANAPLEPRDLERLASAAFLIGRSTESRQNWLDAHRSYVESGEPLRAVRCAFWVAFDLFNSGDLPRGGGWVDRARRLLAGQRPDCVEAGYLRYADALQAVFSGDVDGARTAFAEAAATGERCQDPELTTLARIGLGRCLIYLTEIGEGLALLDEAMISVEAREISPIAVGDSYCTAIEGCQELLEVRRAGVWTAALSRWCADQPELVLYRGQCLVHRAEIMTLHGDWADAVEEIRRACTRLVDPAGQAALGAAHYVSAELHRLQGRFSAAEQGYRLASEHGRDPQPGLALLRLAQGRVDDAAGAIRRALHEAGEPVGRVRLLGPFVEIMLAAADVDAAGTAAEELIAIAHRFGQLCPRTLGAQARGAVQLARGDPSAALAPLREAWRGWRALDAPYQAARVRVLLAAACRALGDTDGADMELDAARSVFTTLGAAPDFEGMEETSTGMTAALPGGLTRREAEVIVLVATGRTNREIAAELVVSEKTVASHLSHVFTKLDLPSRAAVTAFAYENGLVGPAVR
jgi:DNA-binding CsgD family transcriptional regulator/tetratricopeptide (TPR) repeat protein